MRVCWIIVFVIASTGAHYFKLRAHAQRTKERISIQKCKEYARNVKEPCVSGNENDNEFAVAKEFPHMALIGHGSEDDIEWFCSGSLISDQFVLSAAHCAASVPIKGRPKYIRLGALNLTSLSDSSSEDFNISEIITPQDYTRFNIYNDIALFQLDRPVEFSDNIRPACLASKQQEIDNTEKFIVSGWGEERGVAHKHMKQDKNIAKVGYEECNEAYKSVAERMIPDGLKKEQQLCAGPSKTTACQIKSGAPLQYRNKNVACMYNIVGVLSAGLSFCGSTPDIYTNVPGYVDMIETIVWPLL